MAEIMNTYMEVGAIGIIVGLFVLMIMNLMKSQKAQNEDLVFYDHPLYGKPKNWQFLKLGLFNFRKLTSRKFRNLFYFDQFFHLQMILQ